MSPRSDEVFKKTFFSVKIILPATQGHSNKLDVKCSTFIYLEKNQSPPTAGETEKLETWFWRRHETSPICFHSIPFFV
jgi:hypothetical protein